MVRGLRFRIPPKDGSDTIMHDASFSEEKSSHLQLPSRQYTEPQLGELLQSLPEDTQTQNCSSYATQSQFEQPASIFVPKPFQYFFPRRTTPEFGQTWQTWAKAEPLPTTSPQTIQNQYALEPKIEPPLSPSKRKAYTSQLQLPNVLRPEALNTRCDLKHADELWTKVEDFVTILRTLNLGIEFARGQYHEAWNLAVQHSLNVLIQLGYTTDSGQERKFIDGIEKWILRPNVQCVKEEAHSLDLETRRKAFLSLVQSPEVGKEEADLTKKALEDQYRQITHTEHLGLQQLPGEWKTVEADRLAEQERAENVQSQLAQAQAERQAELELQLSFIIDEAKEQKRAQAETASRNKQRKKQETQQRLEAEAKERDKKRREKQQRSKVEAEERAKKKEEKRARHEALTRQQQLAKAKKQEAKAANVVYDNWVKGAPFVPLVPYVPNQPESMDAVPPPAAAAAKKKGGKGGGGMSKAMNKEGTIVGARAPEIAAGNKGRTILEKMGWTAGTGLGASDNQGIMAPVEVVVKHSTLGLGATFHSVRGTRTMGTSLLENSSFVSGGTFQL